MEPPIDEKRCPLCGRENRCEAHSPGRCWCVDQVFPEGLLAQVPAHLRRKACICADCLAAYRRAHPESDGAGVLPKTVLRLQTERLWIREFNETDAPFVRELLNEPSYHQYIGDRGVRTDAQAWDYLRERYLSSYAKHGFGMWRVASRVDDTPVGLCGLAQRDYLDAPDVGFAFLERYAGRGYATESSLEVARYAREELKLTRLLGITSRDNAGSQRVLTKIGLRFDRVIQAPGIAKEMMLFVG